MTPKENKAVKSSEQEETAMEFTGERFTPENSREIWYEHYHRYALASQLVAGLDVLDAACGEGYGSELLAGSAATVTAVDISAETIKHASMRYQHIENLKFIEADCSQLQLGDKKFDAIISFETIEHLHQQEAMLAGFKNLLKPNGWLLISSPDKAEYSDAGNYSNPWHLRELYRQEFIDLLAQEFKAINLFGQKLAFHSIIWNLNQAGSYKSQTLADQQLQTADKLQLAPLYFIAACATSSQNLPALPALNLFADQQASVYQHYNHEVRKNMKAGELLLQREEKITELELRLKNLESSTPAAAPARGWLARLLKKD